MEKLQAPESIVREIKRKTKKLKEEPEQIHAFAGALLLEGLTYS